MKVAVLHQGDARLASTNPLVQNAVDAKEQLVSAVRRCGADCAAVLLDDDMQFLRALRHEKPDLVFNVCDLGLRYDPQLEPHVTAILDTLHLRYTGSNYLTLALTNDKLLSKKLLMAAGIPCPEAVPIRPSEPVRNLDLVLPVICKPLTNHNSQGIDFSSVLYDSHSVQRKVNEIVLGSKDFLLEQYIDGREIVAGFLGNGDDMQVLPLEEIAFGEYFRDKPKVLTYASKWAESDPANLESKVVIPASLSNEQRATLKTALIEIAKIFGIRDYGRVDFRLDSAGHFYAIDVNANPDISHDAGLAKMASAQGLDYCEMIKVIVESAWHRTWS